MEYLETFEPGTKVVVSTYTWGRGNEYYLTKIARQTKTQFVTADNRRFRKDTGDLVGKQGWSSPQAHPANEKYLELVQETVKKQRRRNLIRRIADTKWGEFTTETLEDVWDLIQIGK